MIFFLATIEWMMYECCPTFPSCLNNNIIYTSGFKLLEIVRHHTTDYITAIPILKLFWPNRWTCSSRSLSFSKLIAKYSEKSCWFILITIVDPYYQAVISKLTYSVKNHYWPWLLLLTIKLSDWLILSRLSLLLKLGYRTIYIYIK